MLDRLVQWVLERVEEWGCWSVRGGVTDIWPTGAERPVRVEWFDEEVVSIRTFDPATQRTDGADRDAEPASTKKPPKGGGGVAGGPSPPAAR